VTPATGPVSSLLLRRGYEGAATMHDHEQALFNKAGDGPADGGAGDAVYLVGKSLLGRQPAVGRQRTAAYVRRDVVRDLLPDEPRSLVVDPVSTVTPCHAATIDTA